MSQELAKPWINLHPGAKERDTYLKGNTRMRILSKEILPGGDIKFVATPDGQQVITAEVTVLHSANDTR